MTTRSKVTATPNIKGIFNCSVNRHRLKFCFHIVLEHIGHPIAVRHDQGYYLIYY